MKKSLHSILCLMAVLLITCLPFNGYAEMQDTQGRFLYLDIPYDTITPEGVDQILLDTFGEVQYNEYGKYLITDFGYDFSFAVNFNENLIGAGRVILVRPGNEWATGDAFQELFTSDIMQFVDMESQLIERYGEPHLRFFFTNAKNYNMNGLTRFMFSSGVWDTAQMIGVCSKDKYLEAYSCWDNITLRLWINGYTEDIRGFYSRLYLAFYDELSPKDSFVTVIVYPPNSVN